MCVCVNVYVSVCVCVCLRVCLLMENFSKMEGNLLDKNNFLILLFSNKFFFHKVLVLYQSLNFRSKIACL